MSTLSAVPINNRKNPKANKEVEAAAELPLFARVSQHVETHELDKVISRSRDAVVGLRNQVEKKAGDKLRVAGEIGERFKDHGSMQVVQEALDESQHILKGVARQKLAVNLRRAEAAEVNCVHAMWSLSHTLSRVSTVKNADRDIMYNIDDFLCIIQVSWMRPRDAIKVQKELRIRRASLRKHVRRATIALDLGKWSVLHSISKGNSLSFKMEVCTVYPYILYVRIYC